MLKPTPTRRRKPVARTTDAGHVCAYQKARAVCSPPPTLTARKVDLITQSRFERSVIKKSEVNMNARHGGASLCSLVFGAALLVGATGVAAQPPLKGQVTGAQLQLWLDSKATWAGISHSSGCYYLSTWDGKGADGKGRYLHMHCPNGFSEKVPGTMHVVGDQLCSTFKFPNMPVAEECVSWHMTGDAKFEQRSGELKKNLVYMLSVVPMPKQ